MAKTRSLPDKFYDKDYEHLSLIHIFLLAGL